MMKESMWRKKNGSWVQERQYSPNKVQTQSRDQSSGRASVLTFTFSLGKSFLLSASVSLAALFYSLYHQQYIIRCIYYVDYLLSSSSAAATKMRFLKPS